MLIRRALSTDEQAIHAVHTAAFAEQNTAEQNTAEQGAPAAETPESALVRWLREDGDQLERLSFVAGPAGEVRGHVCASRGWVGPDRQLAVALGPLGVLPEHQRDGIGSALMHATLAAADAAGCPLVCLLGDPGYYSRFGFVLGTEHGVLPPNPQWTEHFQVRPLTTYWPGLRGGFRYAPAFDRLES